MARSDAQTQLVKYLTDAHAVEQQSLQGIKSAARAVTDPQLQARLEEHARETERHTQLLAERLTVLGADTSTLKDTVSGAFGALKNVVDNARPDSAGKVARDVYIGESLEIISYELLARTARQLGDTAVAEVAERILQDEKGMRDFVEASLDKMVAESLKQEGATA